MDFDWTAKGMDYRRNFEIAIATADAENKLPEDIAKRLVNKLYSKHELPKEFVKKLVRSAIKASFLKEEKDCYGLTEKAIKERNGGKEKGGIYYFEHMITCGHQWLIEKSSNAQDAVILVEIRTKKIEKMIKIYKEKFLPNFLTDEQIKTSIVKKIEHLKSIGLVYESKRKYTLTKEGREEVERYRPYILTKEKIWEQNVKDAILITDVKSNHIEDLLNAFRQKRGYGFFYTPQAEGGILETIEKLKVMGYIKETEKAYALTEKGEKNVEKYRPTKVMKRDVKRI